MDENILVFLVCICFLFFFGRIFINPVKKVLKLIVNSILGAGSIFLINLIGGAFFDFHIGINIFTSILVGLLGVPGTVCIVLVKILLL